jgi:hypothetical protein
MNTNKGKNRYPKGYWNWGRCLPLLIARLEGAKLKELAVKHEVCVERIRYLLFKTTRRTNWLLKRSLWHKISLEDIQSEIIQSALRLYPDDMLDTQ